MNTAIKTALLAAAFCGGAFALPGILSAGEKAQTATSDGAAQTSQGFSVEMKQGEVLQVIASELREGGETAARTYGQTAFPIAQSFGFQRLGQLNVSQNIISDFAPEAFSFFAWPDQSSADAFAAHPDWPTIKATRPDAWSELKVYSAELQEDLNLQFDPDKHYTVVVAWLNDEAPGDYDRYLAGIGPAMARAGGRFIYKMTPSSMEAHASPTTTPGQITFVEWDTQDGFAQVQQSPEYLAHRQYFGSSIERFEFYWLKLPS